MITKRRGFNDGADNKVIDLDYYRNAFVKPTDHVPQEGGSFSHFDWLDLNDVDTTSANFANNGVRSGGTSTETVKNFQHDFTINGWDCTKYPPILDTDGEIRDGRHRISAAKENGERWIPCAVYSYSDNSVSTTAANGIVANQHPIQTRSSPDCYAGAALRSINANDIAATKEDIEDYLINKCRIKEQWDWKCGTPSRIVNDVLRKVAEGENSMITKDNAGWRSWLRKNLDGYNDDEIVVLKVGNSTAPLRAWCEYILPRASKGKPSPKFVLYTSDPKPDQALKDMKKFVKSLDKYYLSSYQMVNKDIFEKAMKSVESEKNKAEVLQKKGFSVLGAVPQFNKYHEVDGGELVSLDNYFGE